MIADGLGLPPVLEALVRSVSWAVVVFAGLFVVVFVLERVSGADTSRYRTRNFANDLVYGLFYQGGAYNVLVWAPLAALLEPRVAFARLDLLLTLPAPVAYSVYWLGMDFAGYWIHRAQHSSRWLWEFHAIHHSQERMTFITTNRLHLFDILFANLAVLVPVALLGVPTAVWMPFYFAQQFLEYVQHAELPWRYGGLHRLIVSPVFHAVHHARDAGRHHSNFGKMLSIWDFAFGTADPGARPAAFGVEGRSLPEDPLRQFIEPFRRLQGADPRRR